MSKNKKVMSIAIMPELHDTLKSFAQQKGLSTSAYLGLIAEQVVKINPNDDPLVIGKPIDEEVVPVVLMIPDKLKNDKVQLEKWMQVRVAGIVKAMTSHPLERAANQAITDGPSDWNS